MVALMKPHCYWVTALKFPQLALARVSQASFYPEPLSLFVALQQLCFVGFALYSRNKRIKLRNSCFVVYLCELSLCFHKIYIVCCYPKKRKFLGKIKKLTFLVAYLIKLEIIDGRKSPRLEPLTSQTEICLFYTENSLDHQFAQISCSFRYNYDECYSSIIIL